MTVIMELKLVGYLIMRMVKSTIAELMDGCKCCCRERYGIIYDLLNPENVEVKFWNPLFDENGTKYFF